MYLLSEREYPLWYVEGALSGADFETDVSRPALLSRTAGSRGLCAIYAEASPSSQHTAENSLAFKLVRPKPQGSRRNKAVTPSCAGDT